MPDEKNPTTTDPTDPQSADAHGAASQPDVESLSQVREILLGPVSRSIEQRMTRLEERLDQSIRRMEESVSGRAEELQQRLRDETERLDRDMGELRETHSEEMQQTKSEIDLAIDTWQEKAGLLSEELSSVQQLVRDELTREAGRLRGELVDRGTLSSLFSEIALRVNGAGGTLTAEPGESEAEIDDLLGAKIGQ
jgi:exonuclease VII large subunit